MRLTGQDAIEYAELHDLALCKFADPTEDGAEGLTTNQARAVAREDPSLIYLDVSEHR